VKAIDLEIADREFVVLVGPSGCGKSTTLRMIAGLEGITGGEISIGGTVVNRLPPRARDIAMVFQDYALYPHKTVFQNMSFGLQVQKLPKAEIDSRVRDAADTLGIGHLLERMPRQLSGGQRQRVAMGRAIVRRPKAFLFDEPLSNLDAKLRGEVRTEIKKLHARLGSTIVYVTHDQVEAMTLADRIVILRGGVIEQVGTPDEVYSRPVNRFVGSFIGSPPMNIIPGSLSGHEVSVPGGQRIRLKPGRDRGPDGREVLLGIRPEHLSEAAPHPQPDLAQPGVAQPGVAQLSGRVSVVEPLGSDTLVLVDLGGAELTARLPPSTSARPGQPITLALDPAALHLFDRATEQTLG